MVVLKKQDVFRSSTARSRLDLFQFIRQVKERNPIFYYFGWVHVVLALLLGIASLFTTSEVLGVHALFKPIKFCISTVLLVWSMAFILGELKRPKLRAFYTSITVVILGLEVLYIIVQALRGVKSHFNVTDWYGPLAFSMMGVAISIFTLATLFVGLRLLQDKPASLTKPMRLAMVWGILLFVIFAFEGGLIGAKQGHIVGGPEDASGIPFLGWALTYGDLRIAHFIGMHALQVIPLAAFLWLKKAWQVHTLSLLYLGLGLGVLMYALAGRGLLG